MHETVKLFKRIIFYYLLLAGNIITCGNILPDIFSFRNASTTYLMLFSVVLVFYYYRRVTPGTVISGVMKMLSYSSLFLILLRGIKYSFLPRWIFWQGICGIFTMCLFF